MIKLLIVDDSPLMRQLLKEIFSEAEDFEIEVARSADEALARVHSFSPDVMTLDIHMPDMDGLACLDRIMIERPCPVVMVSSLTEEGAEETLEALALGAVDFVAKPRGPLSLEIDNIATTLIDKVRSAASARIPRTARLADRVRLRTRAAVAYQPTFSAGAQSRGITAKASAKRIRLRKVPDDDRTEVDRLDDVAAVLVGVSTGGPPALDALLQPLAADFPWPIVIAQHMPGSFTGPLARRLDRACALRVLEVTATVPLEQGHVYIGQGDSDLLFMRRRGVTHLQAAPSALNLAWHPSADRLVDSARKIFAPERLIGVLMTGMGNDGASAMAALQNDGGHVIAQDAETSVVWGMPGALVSAGGADLVLPLDEIAAQLMAWAGP